VFIKTSQVGVKAGQWNAFLKAFEATTIPQLEAQAGFMRVICSGDEKMGEANLITMWQTAEQGGGSGRGGDDPTLASLRDYIEGDPITSGYNEILEREF